MSQIKEYYQKTVIPILKEKLGYKNIMELPKINKVVVSVGINSQNKDPKVLELVIDILKKITGQVPAKKQAKKSIAGFKIRKGMVVGVVATLRGNKMHDFLDRLIKVTLPRLRDFRGVSPSVVDKTGNLSLGFRESIAFPEMQSDNIERSHGLEVTISVKAKKREDSLELLKLLGFPLKEK
ncbi:MAG: 50S ribosomal protein L5 [bacterium]|nr:50S ribosomal protein L5 [bacterium]